VGSEAGPYRLFRFVLLKRIVEDVINEARTKLK